MALQSFCTTKYFGERCIDSFCLIEFSQVTNTLYLRPFTPTHNSGGSDSRFFLYYQKTQVGAGPEFFLTLLRDRLFIPHREHLLGSPYAHYDLHMNRFQLQISNDFWKFNPLQPFSRNATDLEYSRTVGRGFLESFPFTFLRTLWPTY